MPRATITTAETALHCQWCQSSKKLIAYPLPVQGLVTVVKPYGPSGHADGPFHVCKAKCLPLASHFGYTLVTPDTPTEET